MSEERGAIQRVEHDGIRILGKKYWMTEALMENVKRSFGVDDYVVVDLKSDGSVKSVRAGKDPRKRW